MMDEDFAGILLVILLIIGLFAFLAFLASLAGKHNNATECYNVKFEAIIDNNNTIYPMINICTRDKINYYIK